MCVDQLPDGYGFDCIYTCKDWADQGHCDADWSTRSYCFNGVNKEGKIKEYCKLSCVNCS